MNTGLMIRWGKPVVGREQQVNEFFVESVGYFGDLLSGGKITYFEPFLFSMVDSEVEEGFFLIKGSAPEIFKLIEEDRYRDLFIKGSFLLSYLKVDFLAYGEHLTQLMDKYEKTRVDLGI